MEANTKIATARSSDVFIPQVDETPVPCPEGYYCTDCVYISELVNVGRLGLPIQASLSDLFNKMLDMVEDQGKEIRTLKNRIKILENDGNKR